MLYALNFIKNKIKPNNNKKDTIYIEERNKTPTPSFDINNKTDLLILTILYELDTISIHSKEYNIHNNLDTNELNHYKYEDFSKNNEIINLIKYENIKQFIHFCNS